MITHLATVCRAAAFSSPLTPAFGLVGPFRPIQNISGARYKKDGKRHRRETKGM